MWKKHWDRVNTQETEYNKYQRTVYPLIMGQCSPALWAQLDELKGFENIKTDKDVVELLKVILSICCRHDQNTDETFAVMMSAKNLFYFCQKSETTYDEYLKEFKA